MSHSASTKCLSNPPGLFWKSVGKLVSFSSHREQGGKIREVEGFRRQGCTQDALCASCCAPCAHIAAGMAGVAAAAAWYVRTTSALPQMQLFMASIHAKFTTWLLKHFSYILHTPKIADLAL